MTENNLNQKKDRNVIKIFGGIGAIFILIIILVMLTNSGLGRNIRQSNSSDATPEASDVAQITEATIETENIDSIYDAESIANGEVLYITCSACHGPDGTGINGMGKDLVNGEFALTATDDELVSVIINGRPIWNELNTTMLDMPPRGGNPTLTDEDIYDIVAYIRSLQSP